MARRTPAPVTRATLQRKLLLNALAKPLNLVVLAALVVAGILLGLVAIAIPIAVVAYLCLVAITFFDGDEAKRVGAEVYAARHAGDPPALDPRTLRPTIARPVAEAQRTAAAIHEAIDAAEHPFADVSADVDALVEAMETSARRAQLISSTLDDLAASGQDPRSLERRLTELQPRAGEPDIAALMADLTAQRDATLRLADRLERFRVGMERTVASLGLMRTRLVEMRASEEEGAQRELARQSRELRERTDLLADVMAEVFADDGEQLDVGPLHPRA
jgi:hypothetical protein